MGSNLRSRLERIRETGRNKPAPALRDTNADMSSIDIYGGLFPGSPWVPAGFEVLKRRVEIVLSEVPRTFPNALAVIVRDCFRYKRIPRPGNLVFFDLETTGLSGGAGTIAFLGSFGRLEPGGSGSAPARLITDQYLLLDYPGEGDFLEALKGELDRPGPDGDPALIVTYNGKTFDSQIFKNRCLMNAIVPPLYFHADLLHPARRLWKKTLPDCSQGTIETAVLGLDRTGDTPGALAPDIWFAFLKTGETRELAGICDHNIRDIRGLAGICLLMGTIAFDPLAALSARAFDLEALALMWRETVRGRREARRRFNDCTADSFFGKEERETAALLLKTAAKNHFPRALYLYGADVLKTDAARGRLLLLELACDSNAPEDLRGAAFLALAKNAEWRERNPAQALRYVESAMALPGIRKNAGDEFERRRERLLKKRNEAETNMKIRIMTIGDYQKVYDLWTTTGGMGMRSLDDSEEGIAGFLARNPRTCFIAEYGEETAGAILSGHDGRRAYIYHAVVKEAYRGKGIGRALAAAVEKAMRLEGINKIALVAFADNDRGNGFWEKLGYETRPDLVYRNKSINDENR